MLDIGFPRHWSTLKKLMWLKAATGESPAYETISGAVASFETKRAAPLQSLIVNIDPVQSGTGDPSPTNVRPISGWEGLHVYASGADTSDYDTLTVTFPASPGTVYGGTLDVVSGVLTVDRHLYNLADYTGTITKPITTGTSAYFRFNLPVVPVSSSSSTDNLICDKYVYADIKSGTSAIGVKITMPSGATNRALFFRPDNASSYTTTTIMTFIRETLGGLWICYKVAPQTYQLTPQEVNALKGQNNIWADTGNVSVTYRSN